MTAQKKLYKLLVFFLLSATIVSLLFAEDDASESIRSDPENFEPAVQLLDPRDILESVPPFTVVERTPYIEDQGYYPCTDCHDEEQKANPTVRVLEEEHDTIMLVHGKGRFWCLTCHSKDNRDVLISMKNQPIDFNDSYLVCGQCHFQRQKDFLHGGHGKRKGVWQGKRLLYNCPQCHNPHVPQIKPRKPVAVPKVRSGLSSMKVIRHEERKLWLGKPRTNGP